MISRLMCLPFPWRQRLHHEWWRWRRSWWCKGWEPCVVRGVGLLSPSGISVWSREQLPVLSSSLSL